MPWGFSCCATQAASSAEPGLRPWSTVKAVSLPPRGASQSASSSASAMLSGPPDTAAATWGRGSKGPNSAISRSKASGVTLAARALIGLWSAGGAAQGQLSRCDSRCARDRMVAGASA